MRAAGVESVELVLRICENVIYEWRPDTIALAGTEIVTMCSCFRKENNHLHGALFVYLLH